MKTVIGNEKDLERAARVLRDGGLVVFPTETVYGLGGNALDSGAAEKIYAAKGRPSDNPLIVHLADAHEAEKYAHTNSLFYRIAERFMPGPLTVILPKRDIIPLSVTGGLDTVALRVPSNVIARRLIELSGLPIAAPSANISGKPSPTKASHVIHDLDGRVDMIIDGGDCDIGLESTIVRIDGEDALTLCRPGAVTCEQLSELCGRVNIDKAVTEKLADCERPIAPGMKYRHYAPSCPVILIDGEHGKAVEYIKERADKHTGVMCFDCDMSEFLRAGLTVSLGAIGDADAHAHRLFDALRVFDGREDIERVYSFLPDKSGISFAVFNRLIKAAGFHTEKV